MTGMMVQEYYRNKSDFEHHCHAGATDESGWAVAHLRNGCGRVACPWPKLADKGVCSNPCISIILSNFQSQHPFLSRALESREGARNGRITAQRPKLGTGCGVWVRGRTGGGYFSEFRILVLSDIRRSSALREPLHAGRPEARSCGPLPRSRQMGAPRVAYC